MIGTTGARMLRLTAEDADIWNVRALNTLEDVTPARKMMDEGWPEMGRDPATLQRGCSILVELPRRADQPREEGPVLIGNLETLAKSLRRHADLDVRDVQVMLHPNNLLGIEKSALVLDKFDGGS